MSRTTPTRRARALAALVAPVLAPVLALATLSACGSADSTQPVAEKPVNQASGTSLKDAWVKAADTGMTAAFGTLVNEGSARAHLVSVSADLSNTIQLHETVDDGSGSMQMRETKAGFVVDPGGTYALEPGGDHIMVMNLARPVKPGQTVTLTLVFEDDSTKEVTAVVKDFAGADEKYDGPEMGDHSTEDGSDG